MGTFIVSEIGVNWEGDFELLEKMIRHSKDTHCDAIKFQCYEESMISNHPLKERLMKSTISKHNIDQISDLSHNIGIEWFCTPMFPDAVDLLEPYVSRFKIREFDGRSILKNSITPLVRKILECDKEVFVSSNINPSVSKYYENEQIKWLYCVPKYPCSLHDLDFSQLSYFDGYSNHSVDIIAPLTAVIMGSSILEVHVTLDKSKPFIDNNVSFDFNELLLLNTYIRNFEQIKTR